MRSLHTDVLIVGAGAGGLMLANSLAEKAPGLKMTLLAKGSLHESNTHYAQGGIAVVSDSEGDSFEMHISDTLNAGAGYNQPDVVRKIIHYAPEVMAKVFDWGMEYDLKNGGAPDLGREGGHSTNRIIHFKDETGKALIKVLGRRAQKLSQLRCMDEMMAVELIKKGRGSREKICGVLVLDLRKLEILFISAPVVVLATGGAGQIYAGTTNPLVATGDGMAMAARASVPLKDMEFVQFHPTALHHPHETGKAFLITEALRGFGAVLRNQSGNQFMAEYDPRADLAPRDIVARAIFYEMKKEKRDFVLLDCSHLPKSELCEQFPGVIKMCKSLGIDPFNIVGGIPVRPAAHYFCGGIATDDRGKSPVQGLFACGECAHTGFHGANRLASNSLLEALVVADWIADEIASESFDAPKIALPKSRPCAFDDLSALRGIRKELQNQMNENAGIIRSNEGLLRLSHFLREQTDFLAAYPNSKFCTTPEFQELRNMLLVANQLCNQSIKRSENLGGFFKQDTEKQAESCS